MPSKYDGMTVAEILRLKKASIRQSPLPPGSPPWDEILPWTWEQIDDAARARRPGFRMIRKLLSDGRFDR